MTGRQKGASPSHKPARNQGPVHGPGATRASVRGASVHKTLVTHRFASYRNHHKQVAAESFQKLMATPLPTLMTVMVIAIALALPAGLFVLLKNAQTLSRDWDGTAQISLYLKSTTGEQAGRRLSDQLAARGDVARTQYISREQALEEFKALSGFGDLLHELNENPLPAVVVVYPAERNLKAAEVLKVALDNLAEVDDAQLDAQWVQRLHAILDLGERVAWSLSLGLSLAVLLVVVNTIRLLIESRRDEIVIVKMVGATDAFVRRPFLYTGLWYGLIGGCIALLLTESVLVWVDSPVGKLSELYSSSFALKGLGFSATLVLVLGSALLGLLGAWVAVGKHLRSIEP